MGENIIAEMIEHHPQLNVCGQSIVSFCEKVTTMVKQNGKLIIAGNGGSMADAQHIAGELMKSFVRRRSLSSQQKEVFHDVSNGNTIAEHLQNGFPVWVLGLNAALTSAILNDFTIPHMEFAQELWVAGSGHDVFLGISTSGKSKNVYHAMVVAKAKHIFTVAFTGQTPNPLCDIADLSIQVPATRTDQIQELQQVVYHTFCKTIETEFYT